MNSFHVLDKSYMVTMHYGFHIALNLKLHIIFKLCLFLGPLNNFSDPLSLVPGTQMLGRENWPP